MARLNVYFGDENFYELEREDGLLYVTLKTIYEGSLAKGTGIRFILDTGAYMTVISRSTAIHRGFDKLPKKEAVLYGFGGGIDVDYVRIPGLMILGKFRSDVPVLIPHDTYRVHHKTGEKKLLQDVLGLNVLEYYNYYIDTANDRLFLNENPIPRFYHERLASGQAFHATVAEDIKK